jgi:hypothetical protein
MHVVFPWPEPVCRMARTPRRAMVMQSAQSLATGFVCPGGVCGQWFDLVVSCRNVWSYVFFKTRSLRYEHIKHRHLYDLHRYILSMVPRLFRTMAALCSAAIFNIYQWRAAWPYFLKSYNNIVFMIFCFCIVHHLFRRPHDTA